MKYWLISDEDVQVLRQSLTGDALHTLETGLHVTDEVPSDFQQGDWYVYPQPPSDEAVEKFRAAYRPPAP